PASGSPLGALESASREGRVVRPTENRERGVGVSYVQGLRCRECGREYEVAPVYTCGGCFGPLQGGYDSAALPSPLSPPNIPARTPSGGTRTCFRSPTATPSPSVPGSRPSSGPIGSRASSVWVRCG